MDVTLDDVIVEYLTENQKTMHWYWQALSYAQAAYEQFRGLYSDNMKVAILTLDSENRAAFPVDAIAFRFIEYKNIATAMKTEGQPNDSFFGTFSTDGAEYGNNFGLNLYTHDAAGPNSSRKYYFRIDWENKQIVFPIDVQGPIYAEYRHLGQGQTDATLVPFYSKEFFKCYIEWKFKMHNRRTGGRASADAQMAEQAWKNELVRFGASRSNLTMRSILEAANRRLTKYGLGETYYNGAALPQ